MTIPFEEAAVRYRFTSSENDKKFSVFFAEEYVVTSLHIWGRYGEQWENVSSWQFAIIIDRLLKERDTLQAALQVYADEDNWGQCEATGHDTMRGPEEEGYVLHAATLAQRALKKDY